MASNGGDIKSLVLLCSHNGGKYIFDQLVSIGRQTRPVDRIYVHDFGSTDGTIEQIRRFIALFPEVQTRVVLHNDAPGAGASFCRALRILAPEVTEREIVYLADQDDIWLPEKNEFITKLISKDGLDKLPALLHHDVFVADSQLSILGDSYFDFQVLRLLQSGVAATDFCALVIGHTAILTCPLVKVVGRLEYDPGFLMHDWVFGLVAECVGKRVFVPDRLSLYRQHENNVLGFRGVRRLSFRRVPHWVSLHWRIATQSGRVRGQLVDRSVEGWGGNAVGSFVPVVRSYVQLISWFPGVRVVASASLVFGFIALKRLLGLFRNARPGYFR